MPTRKLTLTDFENLDQEADRASDPRPIITQLVAAVDDNAIADPLDAPYALYLAAERLIGLGDTVAARDLYLRAVELVSPGEPAFVTVVAGFSRLLLGQREIADGLMQLAKLKPLLLVDRALVTSVTDILVDADQLEVAHDWLTDAVLIADQPPGPSVSHEDLLRGIDVFGALLLSRYHVRRDLGLPRDRFDVAHDGEYDDVEDMDFGDQSFGPDDLELLVSGRTPEGRRTTVVVFPREDHDEAIRRWPDFAEEIQGNWDHHRMLAEQWMAVGAVASGSPPLLLTATLDGYLEYASTANADEADPATMEGYLDSLDGDGLTWPPPRNAPCWCGSRDKYKKCCLPRSRRNP